VPTLRCDFARATLLRLALVLLCWFAAAGPVWAQDDPLAAARTQLTAADGRLAEARRALETTDTAEEFLALNDKTASVERDAQGAAQSLAGPLADAKSRLDQLGPAPEGAAESRDITRQRTALQKRWSDLDEARKRAELLALDARQFSDAIERRRAQDFNEQLTRRVPSPLSPGLWTQLARQWPADRGRIAALAGQENETFRKAVAEHGYGALLGGLVLALVLAFPVRLLLRALGRRLITSRGPGGRLRRSSLALWLTAVGALSVGIAAAILVGSVESMGAIADRLTPIADAFVRISVVGALIAALSGALLSRSQPSWRLFNLDDHTAGRLLIHCYLAVALLWGRFLLSETLKTVGVSDSLGVAIDGISTLLYAALILSALAGLTRSLHRAEQAQVDEADPKAVASTAKAPQRALTSRGGGIVALVRMLGYLAVVAALLAGLLGYLNFALFVARQLIWMTAVWGAIVLLVMFVDDLFGWLVRPDNRLGRALQSMGLRQSLLAQAGALLSAALRVSLVMLGIAMMLIPYGSNLSTFGNLFDTLRTGLPLGELSIKPTSILGAVSTALIGFALLQVLQRWLSRTYLPKTELDAGARQSVGTVVRALGIVLVVLWTLAALGITTQNLALVASALSVGIGFGLQAITQNFISGLILMAERPVKVGDWVRLGDQEGDVKRISVRATEIQIGDRSTLIVPNSELITKSVRNMTRSNALGRVQLQFAVPIGTDMGRVRELLFALYKANPKTLATPAPSVFIDSISGGQANFNSFLYVNSPRDAYGVRSDLFFALLARMAEEGIAMSSPQDIRVVPMGGGAGRPAAGGDRDLAEPSV
jgi:small-conductance mechanosensitive channel